MKTVDMLPRTTLLALAEDYGHKTPDEEDNWHLADFISRSLPGTCASEIRANCAIIDETCFDCSEDCPLKG